MRKMHTLVLSFAAVAFGGSRRPRPAGVGVPRYLYKGRAAPAFVLHILLRLRLQRASRPRTIAAPLPARVISNARANKAQGALSDLLTKRAPFAKPRAQVPQRS